MCLCILKLTEVKVKLQEKHIVLIDDDNPQTHCEISGDKLEKYFDEELEDWYYKVLVKARISLYAKHCV